MYDFIVCNMPIFYFLDEEKDSVGWLSTLVSIYLQGLAKGRSVFFSRAGCDNMSYDGVRAGYL